MTSVFSPLFLERLKAILPGGDLTGAKQSFSAKGYTTVRINTLKVNRERLIETLESKGMSLSVVPWSGEALVLRGVGPEDLQKEGLLSSGHLYCQSLSSMLPVLVLAPEAGEDVLDMCAAPGGKTTQMAALMHNQGSILAIEAIRSRYYKLKSVVSLLGAENVTCLVKDARRFQSGERRFDKILVDAPCSCEGLFRMGNPKTYAYWSIRKIGEMARKQKGLLLNASRLLKEGGLLVYATCTFAPEENEGIIDWILKKTKGALKPEEVEIRGVACYPPLEAWEGRQFSQEVGQCVRVLPDEYHEGFFIARLRKQFPLDYHTDVWYI